MQNQGSPLLGMGEGGRMALERRTLQLQGSIPLFRLDIGFIKVLLVMFHSSHSSHVYYKYLFICVKY